MLSVVEDFVVTLAGCITWHMVESPPFQREERRRERCIDLIVGWFFVGSEKGSQLSERVGWGPKWLPSQVWDSGGPDIETIINFPKSDFFSSKNWCVVYYFIVF